MKDSQMISLDRPLIQYPGNIVSDMDGEKVMMNIHNGKYYNLGRIGGRIWELISNPITVQKITSELVIEYDVEQTECQQQVLIFLDHLYAEGLISFAEGKDNEFC